jgi:hypothetical protein
VLILIAVMVLLNGPTSRPHGCSSKLREEFDTSWLSLDTRSAQELNEIIHASVRDCLAEIRRAGTLGQPHRSPALARFACATASRTKFAFLAFLMGELHSNPHQYIGMSSVTLCSFVTKAEDG